MNLARALSVALLLGAVSCKSAAPPATPLSTTIFEDVVAPRGATYLHANGKSFAYRRPTFRCGRFVFDWQGAEADAVRLYKERMVAPPYSWTFAGDEGQSGSVRLFFVKGDDRCIVDIDRIPKPGIGMENNLSIVVRVNYRK